MSIRSIGHYDIVGLVGSGGMGDVYRARDRKLQRTVALKILPEDVAGDEGRRHRFAREARAVAALNHPNIVTLYAIEQDGDRHFITMELVEGRRLTELVSKDGLPLARFLEIAHPLASAVAAAHDRGITHRDLKPDNVMIAADGALKVLDFGLAKFGRSDAEADVDPNEETATATDTVTAEGKVMGTLGYMSPEQAEGRPVDARSDVFSLGVMFYELLAGHRPFGGDTTAARLAALLRDPPPPLTSATGEIPSDVTTVVARCLAKEPDERYRSARACEQALARLSPGGSPAVESVSRAPGWLPLLYAPIALTIFFATRQLTTTIGLPDWVVPAAGILLAVGAVVLLATALAQGSHRRTALTWRRAITGGVIAFTALGLVTMGFFVSRALGVGPAASLLSSGALRANAQLLLVDADNTTDDPYLGDTITEALAIDLEQSPIVSVVSPQLVGQALTRMARDPSAGVDLDAARELAEREGIETLLVSGVSPAGTGYVLTARLESAETGKVLTALRETAGSRDEVIGAIDELSRKLRNRIGESLRTTRDRAPLEHATTPSLDALHLYTRAVKLTNIGEQSAESASLLREAIAIDPTFAMAYRKLGMVLRSSGERAVGDSALAHAFRLRDRLTERERLLTEAGYYGAVEHDASRALDAYERILARDPRDGWALNNAGLLHRQAGRLETAYEFYKRAVEVTPTAITAGNVFETELALGRGSEAAATIERFAPGLSPIWGDWARSHVAVHRRHYAAAESLGARVVRLTTSTRDRMWEKTVLSALLQARGKATAARSHIDEVREYTLEIGDPGWFWDASIDLAGMHYMMFDDADGARDIIEEAASRAPVDSIDAGDDGLYYGSVLLAVGEPDSALRVFERHRDRAGDDDVALFRSHRAYFEGDYAAAIQILRSLLEEDPGERTALVWIARCHDALGAADSSLVAWERYLALNDTYRYWGDRWALGPAYARLGELHEARGDDEAARRHYASLAELWADGDHFFVTRAEEARRRAQRLADTAPAR